MSTWENYDYTSQHYDTGRVAVGRDLIQRMLKEVCNKQNKFKNNNKNNHKESKKNISISELRILDVGCGTGNYIKLVHDLGCRNIVGLEINPGMLLQCKNKLKQYGILNDVTLVKGNCLDLPFDNNSFDIIFANQMLHHIDTDDNRLENKYPNIEIAIKEMSRCLNNNFGVLMINECRFSQQKSWWWHEFTFAIPNSKFQIKHKCTVPDTHWFQDTLNENGFKVDCYDICQDLIAPKSLLYDANKVFDPKWRAMASSWSYLSKEELDQVLAMIKQVSSDKEKWAEFVEQNEKRKLIYGVTTYYVGQKIPIQIIKSKL